MAFLKTEKRFNLLKRIILGLYPPTGSIIDQTIELLSLGISSLQTKRSAVLFDGLIFLYSYGTRILRYFGSSRSRMRIVKDHADPTNVDALEGLTLSSIQSNATSSDFPFSTNVSQEMRKEQNVSFRRRP